MHETAIALTSRHRLRHCEAKRGRARWMSAPYLHPPVEPGDACLHLAPIGHGSGYLFTPIWLGGGRNVMVE